MANAPKEHIVLEFNVGDRTTWKSVPGSAVAFYASAANSVQGSAELHAAAAEAFGLEGDDHVLVFDGPGIACDAVTVKSPESTRRRAEKLAAEREADLAARKAKRVAA